MKMAEWLKWLKFDGVRFLGQNIVYYFRVKRVACY